MQLFCKRAKCFVLQCIRVHYISLQFNINVQCYQNISEVLLSYCGLHVRAASVFRKKSDALYGFLAYFCVVLRFSDPPYVPLLIITGSTFSYDNFLTNLVVTILTNGMLVRASL